MIALSKSCYVKLQDGKHVEMRDGNVFTWEIRVRQIKIAFDKNVWLLHKHIKQLTQNSLERNIKRPTFTSWTVDRKANWKTQNIQRIFTIHLSLGWSILVEIQIFCRIYFVVSIRGSFPKAHFHLLSFLFSTCKACEETKDVHVHMLDILETVLSSALFSGCWVVEMIDSRFFCFREIYGNIIYIYIMINV